MSEDYERFRPIFAEAIDLRLYSIEHLDALLQSGRAQIWFGTEAAIVTEIRAYPAGATVIHGLVAAGDLDEIVETLIPRAEAWARSIGCDGDRRKSARLGAGAETSGIQAAPGLGAQGSLEGCEPEEIIRRLGNEGK
jgi:hypothetical protein